MSMNIENELANLIANELIQIIDSAIIEQMIYPGIRMHSMTFIDKRYDYGQQRVHMYVKTCNDKILEKYCNREEHTFDEYLDSFEFLKADGTIVEICQTGDWFQKNCN